MGSWPPTEGSVGILTAHGRAGGVSPAKRLPTWVVLAAPLE
jgi:hypothetical protein